MNVRAALVSSRPGAALYAHGLTPLRLAPASFAPASEGERIRVKLPYAGGPVIESILDHGPLATGSSRECGPAERTFALTVFPRVAHGRILRVSDVARIVSERT